ncbi:acyltransferase family protein [Streptomyces sp. NPDC087903]|uniref:acyltransferase family protein n=1 Tax=Streptomyces sp. NPDC087903 TaxID=3365819 RepID=UPI00380F47D9
MSEETEQPAKTVRRGELDVLHALVVLGLVFFHAALVFSPDGDFYVQNARTSEAVTVLAGFGVVWAMPMLFLVAGLGAGHSIRRRGAGGFARERLLRLGVPLVFATLTIVPVPQWLRMRADDPGNHETYGHFWLRFFHVHLDLGNFPFVVQGEPFETGHLWFVVLLLAFCLLLAPVAAPVAKAARRAGGAMARRPVLLLLPALPLAAIDAFLGMEENYAGWNRWAYLLFFVHGYALADDERIRAGTRRLAVPVGVLGLILFAGTAPGFTALDDPFTERTAFALCTRALFGAAGWCWVMAILGLLDRSREPHGSRRSRLPGPLLAYFAVAALPLYVLHQPVVVSFAYGVVGWSAPMAVKYAVIVAASLAVILLVYEYAVRRTPVTRFLFGMRPHPPTPPRS